MDGAILICPEGGIKKRDIVTYFLHVYCMFFFSTVVSLTSDRAWSSSSMSALNAMALAPSVINSVNIIKPVNKGTQGKDT